MQEHDRRLGRGKQALLQLGKTAKAKEDVDSVRETIAKEHATAADRDKSIDELEERANKLLDEINKR